MRVLFIYSNQVRDLLPAPPIGLSYVATATVAAGHEVAFIDLLLANNGLLQLERKLRNFNPEVVAISVRNIDNVISQRLIKHFNELSNQISIIRKHSDSKIVVGGPAISILGCNVLQYMDVDFAVLGEGEETFPALLQQLTNNKNKDWNIPGICMRGHSHVATIIPLCSKKFGASGMQHWLYNWHHYERLGATWPIQCKRGCPLHCTYCTYNNIEGRVIRRRSPEEIIEEIRQVQHSKSPRCFEFVDAVFNMPENYCIELCEAIIRAKLKVNLTTMGINPKFLSAKLLNVMKQAGFNSLMITPESASDAVLTTMRKNFGRAEVIHSAKLIRQAGITSMWFFMLGAPGETTKTAEETVSFAEQYLNWRGALAMFTTGIRILPGTELAQQLITQNHLSSTQDFTQSIFYFSPHVSEKWLLERIDQAIRINPTIVHAAEDPSSSPRGIFIHKLMHLIGLNPPYWRFLPIFLRLSFVHKLRIKRPYTQQFFAVNKLL